MTWVTDFIAEHPDHPQYTKEQAVRALVISIEGHKDRTAEDYKQTTATFWAGLKVIVSQPGGFRAFDDAEALPWTMTLLELESNHVKVGALLVPPFFSLRPLYRLSRLHSTVSSRHGQSVF